jgi:alanine racemase
MEEAAEARPVWASIDLDALGHNARRAIECAAGRAVIGVVKADGYGHGAAEVARGLLAEGVDRLAVVSVAEGATLRRAGIVAPVLLLGGLQDAAAAERAAKWALTPVVHDEAGLELARSLGSVDAPFAVEVEIDTRMHRMGVPREAAPRLLEAVAAAPELTLAGVFTHLANADEADAGPSREQVAALSACLREADLGDTSAPELHVANSAGLLRREEIEGAVPALETHAVRPGLMLYGVSPFADRSAQALGLEPVMTLAARVVAVRVVHTGGTVGYGGEWRAERDTRVATLPLGYADGIPRSAAGRGAVHLAGAMRPIVGRVSMDYVVVEVGETPVSVGDVATVFGRTPEGHRVPVERLASAAGTIGYEILVGVGARVPRRIVRGLPGEGMAAAVEPAV